MEGCTTILTSFMGNEGNPERVEVQEDFDTTMEKLYPTTPPSSNLQFRSNNIFHLAERGNRIYIDPRAVVTVTEWDGGA